MTMGGTINWHPGAQKGGTYIMIGTSPWRGVPGSRIDDLVAQGEQDLYILFSTGSEICNM